jgi:hypothetical protein
VFRNPPRLYEETLQPTARARDAMAAARDACPGTADTGTMNHGRSARLTTTVAGTTVLQHAPMRRSAERSLGGIRVRRWLPPTGSGYDPQRVAGAGLFPRARPDSGHA